VSDGAALLTGLGGAVAGFVGVWVLQRKKLAAALEQLKDAKARDAAARKEIEAGLTENAKLVAQGEKLDTEIKTVRAELAVVKKRLDAEFRSKDMSNDEIAAAFAALGSGDG